MERKEFLSLLSGASASLLMMGCLGSCTKKDDPDMQPNQSGSGTPAKKDFTLNLDETGNASLKTKGNALVKNSVIIAYTNAGDYIAVDAACTHQGATIEYQASDSRFHCPSHGSNFKESGAVINGPATSALKQYKTALTGNNLRIYEA